MQAPKV